MALKCRGRPTNLNIFMLFGKGKKDVEFPIFLGSMLPQYMALSVSFVSQFRFVSFRVSKKFFKCNISLTEAQIFMKFETYVYKIVLDHQPNFHKDPCKDARARGVNARTHVKKNLCVRSLG